MRLVSILSDLSITVWQIFLFSGTRVHKMPWAVLGRQVSGCWVAPLMHGHYRAGGCLWDLWSHARELHLCWFSGRLRGYLHARPSAIALENSRTTSCNHSAFWEQFPAWTFPDLCPRVIPGAVWSRARGEMTGTCRGWPGAQEGCVAGSCAALHAYPVRSQLCWEALSCSFSVALGLCATNTTQSSGKATRLYGKDQKREQRVWGSQFMDLLWFWGGCFLSNWFLSW